MVSEDYKAMLSGKSVIREMSAWAAKRGAEIGYENVFDYSRAILPYLYHRYLQIR